MIKWGIQNNRQRYKCQKCCRFFVWKIKSNSLRRQKVWFKKWILGRRTITEIASEKKCSTKTIFRLFKIFLDKPPVPQIKENNDCHLIIDGTYHSDICLLNYLDNDLKHLQYYEIGNETERNFRLGLELLKASGLKIASITSDGHKELIPAIKEVFPGMIHQRCVVHVQRMALNYLTRFPKSEAGRELRKIVKDLHKINSRQEKSKWVAKFDKWNFNHREYINDRRRSFDSIHLYSHPDIRKARSAIKNSIPNLFYYLDNPKIPKSTNALECRFSYFKNNLRIHRGLSKKNRKNFILWYNWLKYNG